MQSTELPENTQTEETKQNPHNRESEIVEKKYALLKPVQALKRLDRITICPPIIDPTTDAFLKDIFDNRPSTFEPLALDFETRGLPLQPGSAVIGIGLADSRGSWFIDLRDSHPDTYKYIIDELNTRRIPLLAHNVNFDAMWIVRDHGVWLNWKACTYATLKLTSTEGWPGQKWGLKDAQVDLLGWTDSNELELDTWLVDNGHGSRETDGKTGKVKLKPDKASMWRAPKDILGKYCALDADSTYQLYTEVLLPVLRKYKALNIYATVMYPQYERILIEQTLSGIKIDRQRLLDYSRDNARELEQSVRDIYNHPTLRPHFTNINNATLKELKDSEPAKYLKVKERPPMPPQLTKAGTISKTWQNWIANAHKYEQNIISKNWEKWQQRYNEALHKEHFNFNSYTQKKHLFYELLYPTSHLTRLYRKQGDRTVAEEVFRLITPDRNVCLPLTKSGGTPVDRKALRQMGDVGAAFLRYNDLQKEQQFIEALIENSQSGRLYPQFRVPGTLTGRLSGGGMKYKLPSGEMSKGFNIQQIPKSPGFLRCFVPDEGKVFVDCDHTALEQVVLAELSRDPALLKLYGPDASPNDVYLFTGASLPGIGERIRSAGYDPLNPGTEMIAQVKSLCKKERALAKLVVLGSSYKMGPAKLQRTLELEGIKVTFEEAKAIHAAYWALYAGVKRYDRELMNQYEDNDGWVLNGIGRPIGIFESYSSDIVNRVVQSTGHDMHVKYILILEQVLNENSIPFNWVIADFHDQSIVQVSIENADKVRELMQVECYRRLNAWAKGYIELKGDAQIVRDLSYAKVDKEEIRQYLKDLGIVEEEET